jgi:hypothetical protein
LETATSPNHRRQQDAAKNCAAAAPHYRCAEKRETKMKITSLILLKVLVLLAIALPANGAVRSGEVGLRIVTDKTTYRLGEAVKVTSYYLNKSNRTLHISFAPTRQTMNFKHKGDKPKSDTAEFDKSAIENAGHLALVPNKEIPGGKSEFDSTYIDKPGVWEIQFTEYRDGGKSKEGQSLWHGTSSSNVIVITVK